MTKILLTGGHLTPALATIDYLQKHYHYQLVFAGRQIAQSQTGQLAREKSEVLKRGIKFIDFTATKSDNFSLLLWKKSIVQAEQILRSEKVTLLLSFGGYLALPFAIAAKKLHLAIVTHEQTAVFGKANRAINLLADYCGVAFKHLVKANQTKIQYTGNPLRAELFASQPQCPQWFKSSTCSLPWIYISGGSQGSQTINRHVLNILAQLSRDFVIVHQCGSDSAHYHPQEETAQFLRQNNYHLPHYYQREYLSASELAYFYPRFAFAISRAGANSVSEFMAFNLCCLYIPLPQANYREQERNALTLVEKQASLLLLQKDLNSLNLLEKIYQLADNYQQYRAKLQALEVDLLGAERLAKLVEITLCQRATLPKKPHQKNKCRWLNTVLTYLKLPDNHQPHLKSLSSTKQNKYHQPLAKSRLKK